MLVLLTVASTAVWMVYRRELLLDDARVGPMVFWMDKERVGSMASSTVAPMVL